MDNLNDVAALVRMLQSETGLTTERLADCLVGGAILLVGIKLLKVSGKWSWKAAKVGGRSAARLFRSPPEPMHPLAQSILGALSKLDVPLNRPVNVLHAGGANVVMECHHRSGQNYSLGDIYVDGVNHRYLLKPHELLAILKAGAAKTIQLTEAADEAERVRLAKIVCGYDEPRLNIGEFTNAAKPKKSCECGSDCQCKPGTGCGCYPAKK